METQLTKFASDFLGYLTLSPELLEFIPSVYHPYVEYLPLLLIAFIAAFLLTPILGHIAMKFDITDKPAEIRETKWNKYDNPERHIHKKITPYFGGLAVIIPLLILSILIFKPTGIFLFLLIGLLILLFSGVLDDIFNLPAPVQLTFHILAATAVALSTADLSVVKIPFDGTIDFSWIQWQSTMFGQAVSLSLPGDLIIIGWIILCINAVKWVGGVDALAEGHMTIVFILMFVLGIRNDNIMVTLLSLIAIGGLSGLIIYSAPPAKIFSGSTGKSLYGFLVAALAFMNQAKFATTLFILLLPITDAIIVIIIRYFKYKPKNPLELLRMNDTSHLHHQLLNLGFSPFQILLFESSITLLLGSFAVYTTGAMRYFSLILGLFITVAIISIVHIISYRKRNNVKQEREESPESKYSY